MARHGAVNARGGREGTRWRGRVARTAHRNASDGPAALSFLAPRDPGAVLNEYAVPHARAVVQPSDGAWDLLDRLTKVHMSPDTGFPAPRGPGYIVRYSVGRIGGVWPLGDTRPLKARGPLPARRARVRPVRVGAAQGGAHRAGQPMATAKMCMATWPDVASGPMSGRVR